MSIFRQRRKVENSVKALTSWRDWLPIGQGGKADAIASSTMACSPGAWLDWTSPGVSLITRLRIETLCRGQVTLSASGLIERGGAMAVVTTTTVQVKPDRFQEWLEVMRKVIPIMEKAGAKNVRVL